MENLLENLFDLALQGLCWAAGVVVAMLLIWVLWHWAWLPYWKARGGPSPDARPVLRSLIRHLHTYRHYCGSVTFSQAGQGFTFRTFPRIGRLTATGEQVSLSVFSAKNGPTLRASEVANDLQDQVPGFAVEVLPRTGGIEVQIKPSIVPTTTHNFTKEDLEQW